MNDLRSIARLVARRADRSVGPAVLLASLLVALAPRSAPLTRRSSNQAPRRPRRTTRALGPLQVDALVDRQARELAPRGTSGYRHRVAGECQARIAQLSVHPALWSRFVLSGRIC